MKSLKAIKNSYSILTICLILVGAVLLIWPHMALGAICKMCGIFLIIFGLVKLTGYFSKDIFQLAFQYDLGLGIASIIFGLIMVIRSWATIQLFSICIGIFLLIDAALKMQTAFESKKFGFRYWWVTLLIAINVCILGILLFAMHKADRNQSDLRRRIKFICCTKYSQNDKKRGGRRYYRCGMNIP